ncbi:MAG TPA: helix-turn-helix domain-containing protein [Roseimicrobium sp.]|nr:helix-turn-helix domain-containing protein [Roseimicrobium sp.]
MDGPIKLTKTEIAAAFSDESYKAQFPPILNLKQVARLAGKSRSTLYLWVDEGRLDGAFRKRGKSMLFWRDRVIERLFNDPAWTSRNNYDKQ